MRTPPSVKAALVLVAALVATAGIGGCRAGARAGRRVGADPAPYASNGPAAPGSREPDAPAPRDPVAQTGSRRVLVDDREVGVVTEAEFAEFKRTWVLFLDRAPAWPKARAEWIARGGAAPYVLAENLLRYFWHATAYGGRKEIDRIAASARAVGEPAVGYFASVLVLDTWPLKEPVFVPDGAGGKREVLVWQNDDVTRQHLAIILSAIGPPAVPRLSSRACLHAESVSARRYVMYALGRIGTDAAVDAVAGMLRETDWQDRGSAAKALGFALPKNPRAKEPLQRASTDTDPFVRKKAQEALAGKTKSEF